ncbi:hypothetical protein CRX72_00835 [Pantoea sp. BRM17]|nr:hypothetical protein CRX72_00835 [Pantoea sp. BRM17]
MFGGRGLNRRDARLAMGLTSSKGKKYAIEQIFPRHFFQTAKAVGFEQDFCQVLNVPSARKYENQGGPGIGDIMQTLLGSANAEQDRYHFMKAQVLFWLLAATDGHAKNFSVFIESHSYSLDLSDSVENEFLCTQLAKEFGLPVPDCFILHINDIKALAVKRFDRRYASDGSWIMRLPQDDRDLAKILTGYKAGAPLGMIEEIDDFRISLAGAQEKTALLFSNDCWCQPRGTSPTTHILKLPIGKRVYNFFDNLLPDNPEIRGRILARYNADSTQPFDLLARIGADTVGALQLLPKDAAPGDIRTIDYKALLKL